MNATLIDIARAGAEAANASRREREGTMIALLASCAKEHADKLHAESASPNPWASRAHAMDLLLRAALLVSPDSRLAGIVDAERNLRGVHPDNHREMVHAYQDLADALFEAQDAALKLQLAEEEAADKQEAGTWRPGRW